VGNMEKFSRNSVTLHNIGKRYRHDIHILSKKGKGKVIPITGPVWPRGWVEV